MSSISDPVIMQRTITGRQRALMRWYKTHGRHHLPWRKTRDPYKVLVSEVMLQQTQVDRVIPYWNTWMKRWPTVRTLARAKRASVIRAWAGLGYNRRAVYLHQAARAIVGDQTLQKIFQHSQECWNVVRGDREGERGFTDRLQSLPGIGPYTANALLAFAWNLPTPCVDTNVRRVLAYAIYRRPAIMRMSLSQVMRIAARVIPKGRGRDWSFALMDYGAFVLTARALRKCPTPGVGHLRRQWKTGRFEGSSRFWRGRIVAVLRHAPGSLSVSGLRSRLAAFGVPPNNLRALMGALIRDGVVAADRRRYQLPTT